MGQWSSSYLIKFKREALQLLQQIRSEFYSLFKVYCSFDIIYWLQTYGHLEAEFLNLSVSDLTKIVIEYRYFVKLKPKLFMLYFITQTQCDFPRIVQAT